MFKLSRAKMIVLGFVFIALGLYIGYIILAGKSPVYVEESKEISSVPSIEVQRNLKESLQSFADKQIADGNALIINKDTKILSDGNYLLAATVEESDEQTSFSTVSGIISLTKNKVVVYKGFEETLDSVSKGDSGLLIANISGGKATDVTFRKMPFSEEAIAQSLSLVTVKPIKAKPNAGPKEEKTYKDLTVDDWRGMALLTSREIVNKGMAPVFTVPTKSVQFQDYFKGSFYYILAADFVGSQNGESTFRVKQGKQISINLDLSQYKDYENSAVWVHMVTHNGELKNVELQKFNEADYNTMLDGVLSFIATNSNQKEEK